MEGVRWDKLPPELLPAISGGLRNPVDVIRMRSVCRLWRFTIHPPPYKLCPYFPTVITAALEDTHDIEITAAAVYLLRSHSSPSEAWMMSVQENDAGNLVVQQALTNQKILPFSGMVLDLSEFSRVIQLSLTYGFRLECPECDQWLSSYSKFIFQDLENSVEIVVLCRKYEGDGASVFAAKIPKGIIRDDAVTLDQDQYSIQDLVRFNQRVYAVDKALQFYIFDSTDLLLRELPTEIPTEIPTSISVEDNERSYASSFVESEGELYVVLRPTHGCRVESSSGRLGPRVCKVVWEDRNQVMSGCRLELVQDLGDRVFFASRDTSFSVSSLDLPSPWQGNYVVYPLKEANYSCGCSDKDDRIGIYHIGARCDQWLNFSNCDLFNITRFNLAPISN